MRDRTASSTAQFSWALTVNPTNRASRACSSAVSSTSPAASGTRLMQTSTFVMDQPLMRSLDGSNSGVASMDPTVTGYSSSM